MEAGSGSTEVSVVGADPVGGTTVLSLPEGASMMIGEDGEQYVTIAQDGQTYAIPLTEYQTMQPGGTITIQVLIYDGMFSFIYPNLVNFCIFIGLTLVVKMTSPLGDNF